MWLSATVPHEQAPAHTTVALRRVVALLPLASLVRRPVSLPCLMVEVFGTALAVIAADWLAWIAHWLIEQRW